MEAWAGMWQHGDGLVHVIGRYLSVDGHRTMHAECGVPLAALLGEDAYFLRANTDAVYPTCVSCWHASNYGTYRIPPDARSTP